MNVTFDRQEALRLFKILKKDRSPAGQWLRVTATGELLEFENGAATVSFAALVLEPGAFTTRRVAFERVIDSLKHDQR